jgi:undecaprenyl-diphosphatase
MNIFHAIILGVIQGLTEFLPVSSSGHLVIAQSLIPGFSQPGVLFDVMLHAGTLMAVLIYFRKKLLKLTLNEIVLLAVGTLPAIVVGFFFADFLESSFGNVKMVGIELIITGLLCFATDMFKTSKKAITGLDAFLIGIAQAIAIIPGISRSGATIFIATAQKIERAKAAEFSFLLSIPAIAGAILLQVVKYGFETNIDIAVYGVGILASFIFGLLSIKILLNLLVTKNFKVFGVYSVLLGLLVFFLS